MTILPALSLRNKILLFSALLVLIPGTLLGILAERNGRSSLQSVIGRELAREAGHTAERLSTLIRIEHETLRSFAKQDVMREIHVLDLDKRIARALQTLQSGGPSRIGYIVVNDSNEVIATSDPHLLRSPPAWARPTIFEPAIMGFVPIASDGGGLLIATPILDPDQPTQRLGTLLGKLDWSLLTDVTDAVREELSSQGIAAEIAITNAEDSVLRRSPTRQPPGADAMTLRTLSRAGLPTPDFVVDGETGFIAGRASFDTGQEGWGLLVIEPLSHALAPADRLRNRLLMTIGIALAVALTVAGFVARRVLRPLDELTTAIRDVSLGDPTGALVPVRSDDEVGTLAGAFNRMISDLDETQRHLVEAEKFALVGELAAGVAHEVRTSLGVLRSSAQILGRSLEATINPAAREMIDMVGAEVDRLSRVVDDLLTLDHRRPMDMRPTALSIPIQAAIEFVTPQAREKGVQIDALPPLSTSEPTSEPESRLIPVVLCDREAIQQVCVNLLSNAVSALPQGKRIEIRIEAPSENSAAVTIRDNGAGVPQELRERIFDPFVTGRATGVGLGLTFVKRVIHAHRGTVVLVEGSEPGACFRLVLPLAHPGGGRPNCPEVNS